MPLVLHSPHDALANVGACLGPTDWLLVEQRRIDLFAEATGDTQWIHVDLVRAAHGPFGGTIAHGYLTLSLVSALLPQLLEVRNVSMGVNYGVDRVRFPAVLRTGSHIRAHGEIRSAEGLPGGAVQVTVRATIEVKDGGKPVCVADTISRFYPA